MFSNFCFLSVVGYIEREKVNFNYFYNKDTHIKPYSVNSYTMVTLHLGIGNHEDLCILCDIIIVNLWRNFNVV